MNSRTYKGVTYILGEDGMFYVHGRKGFKPGGYATQRAVRTAISKWLGK